MTILYIIGRTGDGMAPEYVLDLVRGFASQFEIHIASPGESVFTAKAAHAGARCHAVPELDWARSPWRAFQAVGRLGELATRIGAELLDAHDSKVGFLAHRAGERLGIPVVYTAHEWLRHDSGGALRSPGALLDWMAARSSTCAIAGSSRAHRAMMRRGIDPFRTMTIHRGAAGEGIRAMPPQTAMPNLVVRSNFDGKSDDRLILEAMAGVDAPAVLTFVGEGGSLAWMRGLAHKLGIGNRVRFLPAAMELAQVLSRSHGLVWLGRAASETPGPVLEAMRAGLPMVAIDSGVVHEAITNGENGYLVPGGDIAGLRNALWALAADASLRKRMGEASRVRFEQNFSMEQMLGKTETVYELACSLSGNKRGAMKSLSAAAS